MSNLIVDPSTPPPKIINGWSETDIEFLCRKIGCRRFVIESFCDRVSKERYFALPVERRMRLFKEHFLDTLKRSDLEGFTTNTEKILKSKPIRWGLEKK
jgi:hypothetical protein